MDGTVLSAEILVGMLFIRLRNIYSFKLNSLTFCCGNHDDRQLSYIHVFIHHIYIIMIITVLFIENLAPKISFLMLSNQ